MTKTTKIAASVLAAGAVALSLVPQSAQANQITGTVSFSGGVVGYDSNNGTGSSDANFFNVHSLVFNGDIVSTPPAPTGTFAGTAGLGVTVYSPLQVSPTLTPPAPSPTPLWSINGTTLSFVASSLAEQIVSANILVLVGTGTLMDGNAADNVTGTWFATLTSSTGGTGQATFSFNSSTGVSTPDGGTSLVLLGLGLTALAGFAGIRKQVA